jgi:hypothetical protein
MHTADALEALATDRVPESQILQYKSALDLDTRLEKAELLKDLTGMGNGGGGTVLFGVDEDDEGRGTARALTPLTDATSEGRMENIVRAGVQPPLLYEIHRVDVAGGFVLEAMVDPSPLGPYMVNSYGDTEGRYFKRHGTRVDQMSEQEVRDAYALAQRAAEGRPVLWDEHGLPLIVGGAPQICVAALPLEPLPTLLDLRSVTVADIRPQGELFRYVDDLTDVADTVAASHLWAQGFVGRSTRTNTHVRLHRDGACGISQPLPESIRPTHLARITNAILAYLGWLWVRFDLRRPVELRISFDNLEEFTLLARHGPNGGRRRVEAIGMNVVRAGITREVEPWELATPWTRHQLVQLFLDSVLQAFGVARAEIPFSAGHLYGPSGSLEITLQPEMAMIWGLRRNQALGRLEPSGAVFSTRTGAHVAQLDGGVVIDLDGSTLAVTEMGTGISYPRDYISISPATDEIDEATTRSSATDTRGLPDPPVPTGQWAQRTLEEVLDDLPT